MELEFIENQLKKFSITDAGIAELTTQYMPLKINGIEDKEGLKAVSEARKVIKKLRVEVDKLRKELNADALEYQRRINAEAKRITSLLEPIEMHLTSEERRIEDELERIKRQKEEEEFAKFQLRISNLLAIGFKFDGQQYITDYIDTFSNSKIVIRANKIKLLDDLDFGEFYENANHYFEIHKAEQIEKERLRKEQEAREREEREAENKRLAEERQRLEALAKENAAKEAALKEKELNLEKQINTPKSEPIKNEREKRESTQTTICEPSASSQPVTAPIKNGNISEYDRGYNDGYFKALELTQFNLYFLKMPLDKFKNLLEEEIAEYKK